MQAAALLGRADAGLLVVSLCVFTGDADLLTYDQGPMARGTEDFVAS